MTLIYFKKVKDIVQDERVGLATFAIIGFLISCRKGFIRLSLFLEIFVSFYLGEANIHMISESFSVGPIINNTCLGLMYSSRAGLTERKACQIRQIILNLNYFRK